MNNEFQVSLFLHGPDSSTWPTNPTRPASGALSPRRCRVDSRAHTTHLMASTLCCRTTHLFPPIRHCAQHTHVCRCSAQCHKSHTAALRQHRQCALPLAARPAPVRAWLLALACPLTCARPLLVPTADRAHHWPTVVVPRSPRSNQEQANKPLPTARPPNWSHLPRPLDTALVVVRLPATSRCHDVHQCAMRLAVPTGHFTLWSAPL
jgi:hypothetical protein